LASVRGEGPIVLLDDALSEIDSFRRNRVLEKTSHYQQVLITTTDLEQVSGYFGSNAVYHKVDGGQVLPYDAAGGVAEVTDLGGAPLSDEAAG
jgi:recombinational DNA repair ATPase RecF